MELTKTRYRVIPRTLVFIFNRDHILLINQAKKEKVGFGKWNGVGGHIERGEDPIEAAIREVYEETGLKIKNLKLKFISLIEEGINTGVCLFIFKGYSKNNKISKSEEGEIRWFSYNQLQNNVNSVKLMDDLPQIIDLVNNSADDSSVKILKYFSKKSGLVIDVLD